MSCPRRRTTQRAAEPIYVPQHLAQGTADVGPTGMNFLLPVALSSFKHPPEAKT
jgi:hypothetical protein